MLRSVPFLLLLMYVMVCTMRSASRVPTRFTLFVRVPREFAASSDDSCALFHNQSWHGDMLGGRHPWCRATSPLVHLKGCVPPRSLQQLSPPRKEAFVQITFHRFRRVVVEHMRDSGCCLRTRTLGVPSNVVPGTPYRYCIPPVRHLTADSTAATTGVRLFAGTPRCFRAVSNAA